MNVSSSDPTAATTPALPSSISVMTMRRRTGCLTTSSDSLVVKPAPVKAERAWKRAASLDRPVSVSATVATRVTSSESSNTTSSVARAVIRLYPKVIATLPAAPASATS
jgi:hypothetical protein